MFNRISFENLFNNVEKAGIWLNKIGIQTKNTRFDDIIQVNREIVEYYNRDLVDELIDKHDNLKFWYALTEASTFIKIYMAFG
jgi:hypothetical protein